MPEGDYARSYDVGEARGSEASLMELTLHFLSVPQRAAVEHGEAYRATVYIKPALGLAPFAPLSLLRPSQHLRRYISTAIPSTAQT